MAVEFASRCAGVATATAAKEAADASALAEDGDKLCLRLRARNENLVVDFGGVTGTNSAVDGLRRGMAGI